MREEELKAPSQGEQPASSSRLAVSPTALPQPSPHPGIPHHLGVPIPSPKSRFYSQLCFLAASGTEQMLCRHLQGLGQAKTNVPGSRGRAREKGVRSSAFPLQKHGKLPENWSQARAPRPVNEPLLCSPGRAWLEAHSGRLLESDRGCPQSTLTRRTPPPSLPPGAEQPARSKC